MRLRGTVGTVQDNTGTAVAQMPARRNRTRDGGWMVAATEDEL